MGLAAHQASETITRLNVQLKFEQTRCGSMAAIPAVERLNFLSVYPSRGRLNSRNTVCEYVVATADDSAASCFNPA